MVPNLAGIVNRCFAKILFPADAAVVLAVFVATLVSAANAGAQIRQLTANAGTCTMFAPSANADGSLTAFESNCDLVGNNADGNREIFQVDSTGTVTQLTVSSGCANTSPSSNAVGDRVAFDSDCDFTGANADASVEIFLAKAAVIEQLTAATLCSSLAPSINAVGDRVAFDSDCDFVATNSDANSEIFRVDASGLITQLTIDDSASGCSSIDASSDSSGDLIAFESDCDLSGGNLDQISEIFQVDGSGVLTQLTASPLDTCLSSAPSSDSAGALVAFESDCDYVGTNADASIEIFRVSSAGLVTQLTDDDGSSACESNAPAMSPSGRAVLYSGFCDPTGDNADASLEIFLVGSSGVEQVTSQVSGCLSFAADAFGQSKQAVLVSDCDFSAANAGANQQIFSASLCFCGAPASHFATSTNPVATDALLALNAAVALVYCDPCDCDVNNSGNIAASDALAILKAATGQPIVFDCP